MPMSIDDKKIAVDELYEIFSDYDIIATSSIFTVQTRMHFEIAKIAKKVAKENSKQILTVSGGVNARSLREHFLSNGFDIIALGEGERTIVQIVEEFCSKQPDYSNVERISFRKNGKTIVTSALHRKATKFIDHLPRPAIDAMPLEVYAKIGIPHWGLLDKHKNIKFSSIQTARGCQDACTFCHISLEKKESVKNYVNDLTHALKSPLTAVRATAELLENEVPQNKKHLFLNIE